MVIVKVIGAPEQTPETGVTTIVADIGAAVLLLAVKFKLPVPFAESPMAVLLFVHVYSVAFVPVKLTEAVLPLQKYLFETGSATIVGQSICIL
jgi:hypothetical protein